MTSLFKATCCGWRNEAQNVRTRSQVRQRFQVHVWNSPFYFLALTLWPHHEGLEEAASSIGISLDYFIYWEKEGLVEGGNFDVAWNIYNVPPKKRSGRLGKECWLLGGLPCGIFRSLFCLLLPCALGISLSSESVRQRHVFSAPWVYRSGQWLSGEYLTPVGQTHLGFPEPGERRGQHGRKECQLQNLTRLCVMYICMYALPTLTTNPTPIWASSYQGLSYKLC